MNIRLCYVSVVALYQNLTWAHMAARCNATIERSLYTDQVPLNQGKEKLVSARPERLERDHPTLDN